MQRSKREFTMNERVLIDGRKLRTVRKHLPIRRWMARCWLLLAMAAAGLTGCTSLTTPLSGVPAHRLPAQFHAKPKNNLDPVDISLLRQTPPREYLVDAGDILGIYVEGVLGTSDQPPPVHMPDKDSDLPPAIGFPIPVRQDGTLSLPLVPPIVVKGLTLPQIENVIRRSYTVDRKILPVGKDRIIVTLMRERRYHVIVMRQDQQGMTGGAGGLGGRQRGGGSLELATAGQVVELTAYKNDVLNALAQTGGLPGFSAKNEVKILKVSRLDPAKRAEFVRQFYSQPVPECLCRPPLPDDPAIIRIPLRVPPGMVPNIRPGDVILEDGDIVLIEGREREVFYTGGLLGGGEFPLPRDYDLDVLGALAIAGQGIASQAGQGGGGRGGGMIGGAGAVGGVPPGQLFILRKTPCNGQITIAVDLSRAMQDPNARPLVQAGDILILQYKPFEEALNFALGTFFTFGIRELFRN